MKTASSILFASRLLFPKTGKKSNARRSLLGAMICIGISLVPLVMVLTVSNGMIQGITDRMIGLSSSHISCILYNNSDSVSDLDSFEKTSKSLKSLDSVIDSYPEIQGMGLAASKIGRTGATIRAIQNDMFERNEAFKNLFNVVDGKKEFDSKNSAIIGAKLAEILNVKAGDTIRLITIKDDNNENTSNNDEVENVKKINLRPKITPLKISGIVSSGYQELDALWIFIPIENGFKILPKKSSRFMIGIQTPNAFDINLEFAYKDVEKHIPRYSRIYRWNELNSAEYENFSSTQTMLLFIMMLIVLVASVNISSALVMLVMERRKEIAILKSLGASPLGVTLSFLITGMVTGGFGVLMGIPLGLLCSVNFNLIMNFIEKIVNIVAEFFYLLTHNSVSGLNEIHLLDPAFYLQNVPLNIPLLQLVVIGSGTLMLSLLMSALPAIKAGHEKPIETLRKI